MSYVKNSISLLLTVVLLSGCGSSGDSKSKNTIVPDNPNFNVVTVDQINQAMERVVAWQKSNWSESFVQPEKDNAQFGTRNWVVASAVPGLLSAAHRLEDQDLKSRLNDLAVKNGWELGSGRYLADDHLIGRLYLHLYQETEELYRIAHIQETFDYIIANPQTSSLYFPTEDEVAEGIPRCIYRWCWSDALYMSPANWHLLTKITGLTKYADFADREFWISARYLYDESASLFYRDSTFFDLQEVNGENVFWSRGNGWVFAGIADILTFIESDHVSTGDYQALFVDMAKALIELQATDGFWRSSLLDQSTYSQPETSGTALFVYGLAWGINNGVLDKETYFDATLQGWRALESAIQPDGKLGWAQTYAASPGFSNIDGNYLYATGAFLLASDEVYKLIQNQD